jgi:hypothetical protein
MKRYQLLTGGALVLSIVAMGYSIFAPSHAAAATTLKGNTLTAAANIGTPTAGWLIASGAPAPEVCQNFLGRARELVCQTKPGYDACLVSIKQGTVDFCALGGDATSPVRRTTSAEAVASLLQKGCKKSTYGYSYTCEGSGRVGWCTSYKNYFELMQMPSPIAGCNLAAATPAPASLGGVPLHHFYELQKDYFHFYTANQDEAAALKNNKGWKYVGITGYVLPKISPGTTPLYRMFKSEFGGTNHFYTTDLDEAINATRNLGWNAEAIVGYVAKKQIAGTVPLYRLYMGCNTPCTGGDVHYYTASAAEKVGAIQNGMGFIRIEAYVWPNP